MKTRAAALTGWVLIAAGGTAAAAGAATAGSRATPQATSQADALVADFVYQSLAL